MHQMYNAVRRMIKATRIARPDRTKDAMLSFYNMTLGVSVHDVVGHTSKRMSEGDDKVTHTKHLRGEVHSHGVQGLSSCEDCYSPCSCSVVLCVLGLTDCQVQHDLAQSQL